MFAFTDKLLIAKYAEKVLTFNYLYENNYHIFS